MITTVSESRPEQVGGQRPDAEGFCHLESLWPLAHHAEGAFQGQSGANHGSFVKPSDQGDAEAHGVAERTGSGFFGSAPSHCGLETSMNPARKWMDGL